MRFFGLAGKQLSHSFSREYFNNLFVKLEIEAEYLSFEGDDIEAIMQQVYRIEGFEGFNVTLPYKREILAYCDFFSPEVTAIGAANCIAIGDDGAMTAYNTDTDGFRHLLTGVPELSGTEGALILGTGGAAAAVQYVLRERGTPFILVSRDPDDVHIIGYDEITSGLMQQCPLLINTTPAGMWPDQHLSPPFPYHLLSGSEIMIDLIYNPSETKFLQAGRKAGCITRNGMQMLIRQAERSWEIWNKHREST